MILLRVTIFVTAYVVLCIPAGHASPKLYDMGIFLHKSMDRPDSVAVQVGIPQLPDASYAPLKSGTITSPLTSSESESKFILAPTVQRGTPIARRLPARKGISSIVSEVIVGAWCHDPAQDNNESNTYDINAELIFTKVKFFEPENRIAAFLLAPRPMIGGSLNNENETNTLYAGLDWMYQFDSRIFIAGSFGFAYHTGNLEQEERQCAPAENCSLPGNRAFVDTGEVTLGSRFLFRESIDIGYRFVGGHGLSIYGAHISNGGILDEDNDGMNFVGIRYSYQIN